MARRNARLVGVLTVALLAACAGGDGGGSASLPTMAVTPAETCEFIQSSVLNGTDEERIEFTYVIFVATLQDRDAAREAIRTDVETACPQYVPLVTQVLGEKGRRPPAPARPVDVGDSAAPLVADHPPSLADAASTEPGHGRSHELGRPRRTRISSAKRGGRNLANRGCGHLSCAGARHGMGMPKRRLRCRA